MITANPVGNHLWFGDGYLSNTNTLKYRLSSINPSWQILHDFLGLMIYTVSPYASKAFIPNSLHTHTVGQTRGRTVSQTHEKRAHETLKGRPSSHST